MIARLVWIPLLLFLGACDGHRVAQLEKENGELSAKVKELSKYEAMDLQEKCANQAARAFAARHWNTYPDVEFTNHYNRNLNKCFIAVESKDFARPDSPVIIRFVADAFEGTTPAQFVGNYQRVSRCTVMRLGKEQVCVSLSEFEELVKYYMEQ